MNLYRLTALYVNVYQICSLFAFEVDCLTFSRLIQMQKWSTGWTVRADLMAKESRSSCSQPFRLPAAFLCVCFSRLITASFKARFILFSWNSPSYDVVNVSNWFGGLWLIMCPGERPFQGYLLHISIQCPSIERTSFLNCWLALTVPSFWARLIELMTRWRACSCTSQLSSYSVFRIRWRTSANGFYWLVK